MGWMFFRKSNWVFPIGLFDSLSYPNYGSILFIDSIPLFAMFFKAISNILPETFQYFGMFGLLCYSLQGIFAFTLLRKYIDDKLYCIIGTVFFIISPYLLQRMFWHTALSSNFLILAGLCLFAYREKYNDNILKKLIYWNGLLIFAITIHLYYVPMILIIMLCTFIAEYKENKISYKSSILTGIMCAVLGITTIYLLGGMSSNSFTQNRNNTLQY